MAEFKKYRVCGVEVPFILIGLLLVLFVTTAGTIVAVIWKWRHERSRLPNEDVAVALATNSVLSPSWAGAGEVAEAGFVEIFNGQDLGEWDFNPAGWSVHDGVIRSTPGTRGSLFWQGGEVEDFELRFRFRSWSGNSGVHYRARQLTNHAVGGYEFEIFNKRIGELSDNGVDRPFRSLFRQDLPQRIDTEWHEGVITAIGTRLIHQIDGRVYCDVEDTHPAAPRRGWIAFGNAVTRVEFKDIRIKRVSTPR